MPTPVVAGGNVTISIKGLGLSYYNQTTQIWETRFLRHVPGHNLKIIVKKNGTEIFSSQLDTDEEISIITDDAESLPSHYTGGGDNDISHMVDFNAANMYGAAFKFNDSPLTLLTTSNACFYTKTISANPYTIRKNGDGIFTRRLGIITGGDIVSNGTTEILFEKMSGNNQSLPSEEGAVYEIIFDNDCPTPSANGGSDFDRFSDVVDNPNKFTLTTPEVLGYMDPGGGEGGDDDPKNPKDPPCTSGLGGDDGGN